MTWDLNGRTLTVHDMNQYEQQIQTGEQAVADIEDLRTQPLTHESVRKLTEPMGEYGQDLAKRLERQVGKTWETGGQRLVGGQAGTSRQPFRPPAS